MKKWIACFLSLTILLSFFTCACAEDEKPTKYESGDYIYKLDEDGNATIIGWEGSDETLSIPEKLDGHTVTGIGDDAFFFRKVFSGIDISDNLTSITLPDSVTSVGVNPFVRCEKLTAIKVSLEHPAPAAIDGVLFDKKKKNLFAIHAPWMHFPIRFRRGSRASATVHFLTAYL